MNKFNVYLSGVARFIVLAGILFLCNAILYSKAMSCTLPNGTSVKQASATKYKNPDSLSEEFSFLIQDFKMNHQGENNNLNIKVRYCYESAISNNDYPDFLSVAKNIQDFLTNYPNDGDYWEIVNKKLTQMVLEKYPVLSSITTEMQVSPSRLNSYTRSSIATRYQSKKIKIVNRTN